MWIPLINHRFVFFSNLKTFLKMSILAYHLSGLNYFWNTALIRWKATAWQNTILTKRYLFRCWTAFHIFISTLADQGSKRVRLLPSQEANKHKQQRCFFPHSTVREPSGRLEAELNMWKKSASGGHRRSLLQNSGDLRNNEWSGRN